MANVVDVVAAVIMRPDGQYLLAQRPPGKVYAGYWEFPGGKIEAGETAHAALVREIREELGIEVLEAHPWLLRHHVYEHAAVRLRFFRVSRWRGTPSGLDGQQFEFQTPGHESVAPMLPANTPVLKALGMPLVYGISNAAELGISGFLAGLDSALAKGLRMVQLRDKALPVEQRVRLAVEVVARCREHGALVLVNGDARLAELTAADGIHLTSAQLSDIKRRPDFALVGGSAHTAAEIARAADLGCDFAVLGPVLPTTTHADVKLLGWTGFASLVAEAELPVYALGGMAGGDLQRAVQSGGHGIAMMRGAWPAPHGS